MPTPSQIRAARGLLNWSQKDLAERAGITEATIRNAEKDGASPNAKTLSKIERAFDAEIEFLDGEGLRRKEEKVQRYQGTQGFRDFMDDVYETAKEHGGEICLLNAKPDNWIKWLGADWYAAHVERMKPILETIDFKVTAKEGDMNFIGSDFAEYRWVPEEVWNEQSFYAYGDRIGFLNFEEKDVEIFVLKQKQFAKSFRFLFNIAWQQITTIPSGKYKP